MIKSELMELLKDMDDNTDITETIQGIEGLVKTFDANSIGLDEFKTILESNEVAKSYYQSSLDSGIGKGVASFKEKTLPKLIEEGIKAKSNENKSPEQIAYEEMKSKYEAMEKQIQMKDLTNKYSKVLNEKGLPLELVDYILGDGNEEVINGNIDKFTNMFSTTIDSKVNEKLKTNSYVPPKDGNVQMVSGVEQAFYAKNPSLAPQQ
ncbi:DUF4355 domain-containing protein [Clostridium beijerinckii]|uniref:DUF4355 domain-containing protein n=1 Tax=Clostridium beijerinckii TaxID=1520 RepID=UPI00047D30BC|nr:DUF4355 domain-containing protein [Clostridium beijerinckii]